MFQRRTVFSVLVAVVFSSATAGPAVSPDVAAVSVAVNEFAFGLYRSIGRGDDNVAFSPLSLTVALALAYAGAEGQTAQEMGTALYWGLPPEQGLNALAELVRLQNETLNRHGCLWKNASRVWIQSGFPILDTYSRKIGKTLSVAIASGDFAGDPEKTRGDINEWVRQATESFIPELLAPGALTPDVRMALVNAAYFKGPWAAAFDSDETALGAFWIGKQKTIDVPMMKRSGRYHFHRDARVDILRLPYRGYRASMLILLPRAIDELSDLEQALTADQLSLWRNSLEEHLLRVEVPKFEIEAYYDMREMLERLGMKRAFSDDADFSGMTGQRNLKIDPVVHRAKIKVDEKGAEAAAASGIMMQLTSAAPGREPIVVRVDHPFVFIVFDEATQTILFIGRVARPPS